MSWDQILGMFAGGNKAAGGAEAAMGGTAPNTPQGAPAPAAPITLGGESAAAPTKSGGGFMEMLSGAGQAIGDTMLGNSPRTDSLAQFTGDIGKGLTNPHGLVGQIMRIAGAVASFQHSPQSGMQFLSLLEQADAGERKDVAEAAARGWTPGEYEDRTGQQIPPGTQTALQARDMPMPTDPNSPQSAPSMPNRQEVIQFPNTPEELTAARDAELMQRRSMPNFGVGTSAQEDIQQANLAQRKKMPLGANESSVLSASAAEGFAQDPRFRGSYTASDQGVSAVFSEIPPENRSMSMEVASSQPVPEGYTKVFSPDPTDPNKVFMKIVDEKGKTIWDRIETKAAATGKDPLDVYTELSASKTTPKGFEGFLMRVQEQANAPITPEDESILKAGYGKAEDPMFAGKIESPQSRARQVLIKYGVMEDPEVKQALIEKEQLFREAAASAKAEEQPQQGTTPVAPAGPPGAFALGPTGQRIVDSVKPIGQAIVGGLSTVPVDSPGYVPPATKEATKSIKASLDDLKSEDVVKELVSEVIDTLTATKSTEAAGEVLASLLDEMPISKQEKVLITRQIVDELGLDAAIETQIAQKVFQNLGISQ